MFDADLCAPASTLEIAVLPPLLAQASRLFPELVDPSALSALSANAHVSDPDLDALLDEAAPQHADDGALTRRWLAGRQFSVRETAVDSGSGDAHSSSSLQRAPAPLASFVRGSVNNLPFRPGGLDQDEAPRVGTRPAAELMMCDAALGEADSQDADALADLLRDPSQRRHPLLACLPGLPRGLHLPEPSLPPRASASQLPSAPAAASVRLVVSFHLNFLCVVFNAIHQSNGTWLCMVVQDTYRVGSHPSGLIEQFSQLPQQQLEQV